jgi:hypothetical protein
MFRRPAGAVKLSQRLNLGTKEMQAPRLVFTQIVSLFASLSAHIFTYSRDVSMYGGTNIYT